MTQKAAKLFGAVFVLVGVLGFVLTGFSMEMGLLLGVFPVNLLHNVVHLLLGLWGLNAARSVGAATIYCRVGGVGYLVLGALGFVTENLAGMVPLGGNDRWLHLGVGVVLAYAGFASREQM